MFWLFCSFHCVCFIPFLCRFRSVLLHTLPRFPLFRPHHLPAEVHDAACLRLLRGVDGREVLPDVLRRSQKAGHDQPETIALLDKSLLPTGSIRGARGGGDPVHRAQGRCFVFRLSQYSLICFLVSTGRKTRLIPRVRAVSLPPAPLPPPALPLLSIHPRALLLRDERSQRKGET